MPIGDEGIHNLTGLIKRYVRDLPEPILDEAVFPALYTFCAEPHDPPAEPTPSTEPTSAGEDDSDAYQSSCTQPDPPEEPEQPPRLQLPLQTRIMAAQTLLKLLPPSICPS